MLPPILDVTYVLSHKSCLFGLVLCLMKLVCVNLFTAADIVT